MNQNIAFPSSDEKREFSRSGEIYFADILVIVGLHKKLFFMLLMAGLAASLAIAFTIPRYYVSTTLVMPPQQQNSAAGSVAQLSALAGVAGSVAGIKTPDEMYLAMFKSRTLQDTLIQQFDLKKRYGTELLLETREMLASRSTIVSDKKSGLITVAVDDGDPQFASKLANAYVIELKKILSTLAVTEAQQRRIFFQQQVEKTKTALNDAELRFRQLQMKQGILATEVLAEASVKASVDLRRKIAEKEVQLQALGDFATSQHPEVQRTVAELNALRSQLALIEEGDKRTVNGGEPGIRAVTAYRDMKVQSAALDALLKQLELSRIDEAREGPLLQQIDLAVAAEKPSKPRRKYIVLGGLVLSLLASLLIVVLVEAGQRASGGYWSNVRKAWRFQ